MTDIIEKTLNLISKKSISGEVDQGAIDYLIEELKPYNFKVERKEFKGDGSYPVDNFYAEYGNADKNLCFAGHTDVVSPGDESEWSVAPFEPKVVDDVLIGRGAVDMKSSIISYLCAVQEILDENSDAEDFENKVKLSFLITGDEEADGVNGTIKLLKYISSKSYAINAAIVGEPTNPGRLGEMIKVGRRGSINFKITVNGTQGHVAYPAQAENPITPLIKILDELKSFELDKGNEFFQPSNLEVTSIDVGNDTTNIIPQKAEARLNIRFNNNHDRESIKSWVREVCLKHSINCEVEQLGIGSESFLSNPDKLANNIIEAISETIEGVEAEISTSGGTSDARFIKDFVDEVVEFGLINKTAHKVDEQIAVEDIIKLKEIYKKVIIKYFNL
jgi:succinyl-diaminopimelate desuccinylase